MCLEGLGKADKVIAKGATGSQGTGRVEVAHRRFIILQVQKVAPRHAEWNRPANPDTL